MSFKIYTKTGDKGETSLFGGARVPKSSLRIEAYGTVDELNSYLGLVRDHVPADLPGARQLLKDIQDRLFVIGANLASDPSKQMSVPDVREADIETLERAMDAMDAELPPLKNFILPGGHPAVSHGHVARCICRRTERLVVALHQEEAVPEILIRYLNRLSDYLFVLSRKLAQHLGAEEIAWMPRSTP
jgi:cob(I)alamin adenosyltransferase